MMSSKTLIYLNGILFIILGIYALSSLEAFSVFLGTSNSYILLIPGIVLMLGGLYMFYACFKSLQDCLFTLKRISIINFFIFAIGILMLIFSVTPSVTPKFLILGACTVIVEFFAIIFILKAKIF